MLGALAKARAQRARGAPAPAPHSPLSNPATPKIVLLKAKDAGAPKAKPAANGASYAAKDCNCEWAGADHDRDGRADGCNGGDDGSICWSACCSPASLLPPIFLQEEEGRAADAAVSFLELGMQAKPSAEAMPASESMQAKLDAVLASGVVTGIAAGTAPQETSATTAPSMFAAAAAALAAADPSAAAAPLAATSPLAAPLAGPVEMSS